MVDITNDKELESAVNVCNLLSEALGNKNMRAGGVEAVINHFIYERNKLEKTKEDMEKYRLELVKREEDCAANEISSEMKLLAETELRKENNELQRLIKEKDRAIDMLNERASKTDTLLKTDIGSTLMAAAATETEISKLYKALEDIASIARKVAKSKKTPTGKSRQRD